MNQQEIFDTVARHLIKQGGRSVNLNGIGCVYRGAHGRKCALGVLIPDEMYNPHMDQPLVGGGIFSLLEGERSGRWRLPEYFKDQPRFLAELQSAHDRSEDWATLPFRLRDVAATYGLSPAVLDEQPALVHVDDAGGGP